jgi:ATP-dependent Clp protease ATP-binding subunit ClpA
MEEKNCGETPQARPAARRDSHDEDARPPARRSSHVGVELDESVVELILREGFSEAYGARNLERVMDRMLGTLIAEALLSG